LRLAPYLNACSNVHSDLDVGLLNGIMMGRSLMDAIIRTTSSEKAPGTVDTPAHSWVAGALLSTSRARRQAK
jgi:hypothetical protein